MSVCLAATLAAPITSHAEWRRDSSALTWRSEGKALWTFSFDPQKGKPFFHPLSTGGASLTNFRPEDHPWHYGLWFSWKYINDVNYWEEDRGTDRAQGATQWATPEIDARPDGSATIRMSVRYRHPVGRIDLTEERELEISAPDSSGGYTIDWRMRFTAGEEGAVLDRTPMPGEPDGKVNGGYAGLSARLASAPLKVTMLTPEGVIGEYASDRARPQASAVAANFTNGAERLGGLAILSDPANSGVRAPWYLINADQGMRFLCAAVLAPQVRRLAPGAEWKLNYRIAVQRTPWTPMSLAAATKAWPARAMSSAVFDWRAIPAKQTDVRLLRQFFQSPTATLAELEVHATTLAPGESSHPPHRHSNEELVIVKEGVLEAFSNGARQRVGAGSVIFNASNELHAVTNVGAAPATYHVINWKARE